MRYKNGLVSIVMPAYNASDYIVASIDSVIKQSYENWELIIVNDCSSDNTSDILYSIDNEKIKVINNLKNNGVALSRNVAISHAKGQYLAFLDSDDLWLEDKLMLQVKALESNQNAISCHTSYDRINSNGEFLCNVTAVEKVNFKLMLKGNFIGNLTGIIDRNKIFFDISQKKVKHEDYLMWLEILKSNDVFFSIGLKDSCAKYRVVDGSVSSNKFKSVLWHWNILRCNLDFGCLISIRNVAYYIYYAVRKRT
ncbi:glycosyltransferase family 2 protein [Vibrio splendidus]|uniref:glycosyltransferase family 2 protein n=1 Tax=Vibrio splendidus TaxID=29497 RepID=UPI0034A0CDEC